MSAGLLSVKATPHWPTQSSWSRPDLLDDLTTMGAARFGATPASHVVLATPSARFWDAQRGAEGSVMTIINRSEEHTSELQSLMRISYAVFCLQKKTQHTNKTTTHQPRITQK